MHSRDISAAFCSTCIFLSLLSAATADAVKPTLTDEGKPILVAANLLCAPITGSKGCNTTNQSLIGDGDVKGGFRFGLMSKGNGLVDIGSEFFSAVNSRIAESDFDGNVHCAGSPDVLSELQNAIKGPAGEYSNQVLCQVVYACPKFDGAGEIVSVTGKRAQAIIRPHEPDAWTTMIVLKC